MTVTIFDDTRCELGEGPLWHPERRQLYWFDILGKRLLTREAGATRCWSFDEHVSAAGWIDRDRLLVASETALFAFDLGTSAQETVAALEADTPGNRSNDGRADPWGGFWIGTMGKGAEPEAGAIYRFYRGELRRLHGGITIPNAICFAPDRSLAYFADTARQTIWRQKLAAADGWPCAEPEVFLDLSAEDLNPDGAVVDAEGRLWNAQWGAGRVACYAPDGQLLSTVALPASRITCPAFGNGMLYATSAREGMTAEEAQAEPKAGMVFAVKTGVVGQREPRVVL